MADDKGSFVVYLDIKEIVDELEDTQVAALFRAMLDYQTTGKVPKLTGSLKYIFIPIRQQMDRDKEKWNKTKAARSESGRKGGLKSGEIRAKQKEANEANASFGSSDEANEANEAVNVNVNVNGNVNGNVDVPEMSGAASSASYLIKHLNEKAGTNYYVTLSVEQLVSGLLNEGYSVDQIRTVIDKKCAEWLGDEKMQGYLRPSTLFGDKFGEYLAAPVSIALERERETSRKKSELNKQLEEKRQALSDLNEALPGAEPAERRLLREQIAILEDSIGVIERRLA